MSLQYGAASNFPDHYSDSYSDDDNVPPAEKRRTAYLQGVARTGSFPRVMIGERTLGTGRPTNDQSRFEELNSDSAAGSANTGPRLGSGQRDLDQRAIQTITSATSAGSNHQPYASYHSIEPWGQNASEEEEDEGSLQASRYRGADSMGPALGVQDLSYPLPGKNTVGRSYGSQWGSVERLAPSHLPAPEAPREYLSLHSSGEGRTRTMRNTYRGDPQQATLFAPAPPATLPLPTGSSSRRSASSSRRSASSSLRNPSPNREVRSRGNHQARFPQVYPNPTGAFMQMEQNLNSREGPPPDGAWHAWRRNTTYKSPQRFDGEYNPDPHRGGPNGHPTW